MSDQRGACIGGLRTFIVTGTTDDTLKLTPMAKAMEQCGLSKYVKTLESSIWAKHCDKAKKCKIDVIYDKVIPSLAQYVVANDAKNKKSEQELVDEISGALAQGKKAATGAQSTGKAKEATDRLTDTSGYTGAHKERFGADGKGKGIDGREDRDRGSGYVGNYKNEGTYDKTHKK